MRVATHVDEEEPHFIWSELRMLPEFDAAELVIQLQQELAFADGDSPRGDGVEGEIARAANERPGKHADEARRTPTPVVLLDPPQIAVDSQPFALKYEAAVWLKALVERQDWLSSSEFNEAHPELGGNVRPDRFELPEAVKKHVKTDRRKGSRWH